MQRVALLAVALAALACGVAEAKVYPYTITFAGNATSPWPSIASTKGQFNISLWRGDIAANGTVGAFQRHICNTTVMGAACNAPPATHENTVFQFRWAIKNATAPLKRYKDAPVATIEARLCYMAVSYNGRPWRKKNKPYPMLSQNCPIILGSAPFANSGTFEFPLVHYEKLTTALWFPMMWTRCDTPGDPNGADSVCAFESTEAAPNSVETTQPNGITTGMTVGASILGAIGPIYFVLFWIADNWYWNRTGHGIKFIKNK